MANLLLSERYYDICPDPNRDWDFSWEYIATNAWFIRKKEDKYVIIDDMDNKNSSRSHSRIDRFLFQIGE